ncbi:uncharacterized protein LOC123721799 [Papilio machaon]|uniref:uncharacterized protein LOC123721799 n=1 Tax=Papilio machaon TaxID=76193 RepID=UPI001E665758|nr:uncharacterized protein LOC123721799 [Papilio machaon]
MKPTDKCIRIRDTNKGKIDVENVIKSIEDKFKIDFKTLPKWKCLIEKLYIVPNYRERKIEEANLRKLLIIQKLCIENSRLTPFELTDILIRTVHIWQKSRWMNQQKQHKTNSLQNIEGPLPSIQNSVKTADFIDTSFSGLEETAEEDVILEDNGNKENEPNNEQQKESDSKYSELSYHSLRSGDVHASAVSNATVCHSMNFKLIECCPKELVISNKSPMKQTIKFSLKNTSLDCVFARFKNVTNHNFFKKANVLPYLSVKLYPGLSMGFKFIFNLKQTEYDFLTSLTFLMQYKDGNENFLSEYCVNISTQFKKPRCTKVSEIVHIPPVYSWHLNPQFGHPCGILTVESRDEHEYDIRIVKHKKDLSEIESCNSNNATMQTTTSDSVNEISTSFIQKPSTINEVENNIIDNFMLSLVKNVIEAALDTFVFDVTSLHLSMNSKRKTSVYLSKCEYIGYHQSYFDVEFRNVDTYELIETKTTRIFAEILPHPIEIHPTIFDMSNAPVVHGVCVDHFIICNTHKIFSSTIKIDVSNITKKLITIKPMAVCIQPETSVKFQIRTCPSKQPFDNEPKVMIHFTVKIIATGVKSIYNNISPIFYEIIAPCALGFCEMYDLLPHQQRI